MLAPRLRDTLTTVTPTDFRHRHRIRVRYCETDRMGVAHHGSYVNWFEEARTEWMRERGKTYRALEDEGILLQIVDLRCSYKRSITYDDVIEIETRMLERKRARFTIGYTVYDAATARLVAEGATTLACVGRDGKLRRLPDEL